MKTWIGRILLGSIIAYGLLLGALYFAQDRLLYPARSSPPGAAAPAPDKSSVTPWLDGRGEVRAWIIEAKQSTPAGTVVLFHGNANTAADRFSYARPFLHRHFRLVLAEYPGYGDRPATELSERLLANDGARLIKLVAARWPGRLVVAGESLGAGVAAAAIKASNLRGTSILLFTPWNNLPDVASQHYPWAPVRWLLKDRYDTCQNLKEISTTVKIVFAQHDTLIPPGNARALAQCLGPGRAALYPLWGASHNNWFGHMTSQLWDALLPDAQHHSDSPG